jgi:hypothetical protein
MIKHVVRVLVVASCLFPSSMALADPSTDPPPSVVTGTDPEPTYATTLQIALILLHLA